MTRILTTLVLILLSAPSFAQPCEGFGNAMDALEAHIAQTRSNATQQTLPTTAVQSQEPANTPPRPKAETQTLPPSSNSPVTPTQTM
jgi:Tfp pilus assembly protein FimT